MLLIFIFVLHHCHNLSSIVLAPRLSWKFDHLYQSERKYQELNVLHDAAVEDDHPFYSHQGTNKSFLAIGRVETRFHTYSHFCTIYNAIYFFRVYHRCLVL